IVGSAGASGDRVAAGGLRGSSIDLPSLPGAHYSGWSPFATGFGAPGAGRLLPFPKPPAPPIRKAVPSTTERRCSSVSLSHPAVVGNGSRDPPSGGPRRLNRRFSGRRPERGYDNGRAACQGQPFLLCMTVW